MKMAAPEPPVSPAMSLRSAPPRRSTNQSPVKKASAPNTKASAGLVQSQDQRTPNFSTMGFHQLRPIAAYCGLLRPE